ncbi:diguanylate cyclase (GGDEF) domain-containing protein [Fontibacillus panacisegetis]|uniref:Diguanylate cyclase (GGDEF) domain-containing protein n=1 Tax=Fontibacillus panacisegetis TaxID=670482 RepID=A0A1G7MB56_9BACL|nr:EAL domain-containing protein [Fontibacillus panacisegetis]SDF58824.1 diguanylate cyclase (GGDEF) domain-containing protein [Fontibacillus panacisegetis]
MAKKRFTSLRLAAMFMLGLALALFSESHDVNLIFGISLTFTNIILLLLVRAYGFKYSLFAALLVYSASIFVWDNPYAVAISLLEFVVVGLSLSLFKKDRSIIVDWMFWLILGAPVLFLLYSSAYGPLSDELWLMIAVPTVNGLFNVMTAEILWAYTPGRLLPPKVVNKRTPLFFYKVLYHIIFVSVTLPFLFYIVNNSWSAVRTLSDYTSKLTFSMSQHISQDLQQVWDSYDNDDKLSSTRLSSELQNIIHNYATNDRINILFTDEQGNIIAKSPMTPALTKSSQIEPSPSDQLIHDGLYLHVPSSKRSQILSNQEWSEAKYIYKTALGNKEVNLYILVSMNYFKDQLYCQYLGQFLSLLLFFICAAAVGKYLNSRLLRALNELTDLTTNLPDKLYSGIRVEWPESRITEIRALIRNFRAMSNTLIQMFQESIKSNQLLQEQTSQLQKSEKKLHHLAYYDELTRLPNRLHFTEYIKTLNLDNPDNTHPFALMFADLNRFKQVNDILGHTVGDRLLYNVAERFSLIVSEQCKVFRISGDEFLFILHYEDISDVQRIAQNICDSLETPFEINGRSLYMSVSVGISVYPYDGNEMDLIMRNADIAMYVAKEQGDGFYHFYDSIIENQRAESMQLENELKSALRDGQFTLYYQPKIDAVSNEVIGAEALIRWIHPEYGIISPAKFIPLAENSGIILDIDEWVLREACRQNKAWQDQGLYNFPVAVNISARHFYQSNLIPMITRILEETGLDPCYVVLEITEGTLIKNVNYGIQIMEDITKMGIRISMDDFGTGYSSLSQLERLPISEMKLDRSFIEGLTDGSRKSSLVRAVIELGHHMELKVVAEGIESPDDLKFLTELKCDEFQGYFFSKPLPGEEFCGFIRDWDSSSVIDIFDSEK